MTAAPHWSQGYIGLPYVPLAFDCAHFLERVQREVFGRRVAIPKARPNDNRSAALQQLLCETRAHVAEPVAVPQEGDAAVMIGAGRLNHVGVAAFMAGEWYVVHNFIRARQVVAHRVRDLDRYGLVLEGWYRWI